MHYDESTKRRNLLAGLVFGTVLGAGLALLFLPGDGVAGRARVVARSVRGLGAAGRRTRAYAQALHARLEEPADDGDLSGDAGDEPGEDGDEPDRPARVHRMARRRFTL